jgi:hypothetical protein
VIILFLSKLAIILSKPIHHPFKNEGSSSQKPAITLSKTGDPPGQLTITLSNELSPCSPRDEALKLVITLSKVVMTMSISR